MRIIPTTYKEAAHKKNVFIPLFRNEPLKNEKLFLELPKSNRFAVEKLFKNEFRAEDGETKSVWFSYKPVNRVRLFGRGEKNKWNYRKIPLVARRFVQYAKGERISEFSTSFGQSLGLSPREGAKVFAENALAAAFEFNKYKEKPRGGWPEVKTIYLAADKKNHPKIKEGIREGTVVGEEINHCRDLANTPGGDMTPRKLAEAAETTAKKAGLGIKILEDRAMKKLGMGGVLGVAQGSNERPRFIILEYFGGKNGEKPLVLIGKGVTFDTGGLNIKPEGSIYEMHMDMSGGAAVIHGMTAVARLKLPVSVVGIIPAVENMPSGSSYRPGDLLKTMSGKTIEVLNTDAEGRVILSDALWYGATKYKPGLMVDLATLTGAAQAAIGRFASLVFTNRSSLTEKLKDIGARSGDYVWPMPLWDEYLENIKGTFGDWANVGKQGTGGGAINGAKFLEQFVKNTPWAHIDIAPRMTAVDSEYLAKGASGVGIRYIVELAKEYPKIIN